MTTNVCVVDGGGRGHALVWKILQSKEIGKVYAAPGNGGIGKIAERIPITVKTPDDVESLLREIERRDIGLTIVGSDNALAAGIVDRFRERGHQIFGPTCKAARIESDKGFAKRLMRGIGIPTPPFAQFQDHIEALEYVKTQPFPLVIKAPGLAFGKGVYICRSLAEAEQALYAIMILKSHGADNTHAIVEEHVEGREVSVHAISDGRLFRMMPLAQDYKRLFDGGLGSNTGGMGARCPIKWVSRRERYGITTKIVWRLLRSMRIRGTPFAGFLYPGLMMTAQGPMVLEFNARLGDPEAQVLMRLLKTDLLSIIMAAQTKQLHLQPIRWRKGFAVCVVLASEGYPQADEQLQSHGYPRCLIEGLEEASKVEGVEIFHAGTEYDERGQCFTAGGRVLSVTAYGKTLELARDRAYEAVNWIHFKGMHYRTDIAAEAA